VLFEVLFGWISYALVLSLIGFVGAASNEPDVLQLSPSHPLPRLTGRTAILMPVYNEDPSNVFARLTTMDRSLRALGAEGSFNLFVLSDTRDDAIAAVELDQMRRLRAEAGEDRAFYRRRTLNHGRKAGNIAEWVTRFGGAYDHMVVLDADSLMDGETLVRLAGAMEANAKLGLLQTAPRLVNRTSLFGRIQQFGSRLYGPMLTDGLTLLWGTEGNYWGHNAIIRTRAFAEQAGLPVLQGRKPFGGEIMSHDFVEAALLRRAGWEVRIAARLEGSFEECPPTLPDLIVRERRWCQGNLQHVMVVGAKGLHPMSRFHLVHGVLAYVMSPLWFVFLILGALLSVHSVAPGAGQWDDYSVKVLRWVSAIAFLSLFGPRILSLAMILAKSSERAKWGRPGRLALGVLLEIVISALIAPILMISQTKALVEILTGRDAGWSAQTRGDGSISWDVAFRRHGLHMGAGVAMGVFSYWVSPSTFLWLTPVIFGLLLSAPLTVLTADMGLSRRVLDLGLFATPEELDPPAILRAGRAAVVQPEPALTTVPVTASAVEPFPSLRRG
jgi:membrane glycosyltransferase